MYLLGCKQMERLTRLTLVILGIGLSFYALHVKQSKLDNDDYEAFCDINEKMSCSAIFTSKYGRGFGLLHYIVGEDHFLNQSNSLYGIFYFLIQVLGCFSDKHSTMLYWMTSFGILSCIYLAYILAFILEDFCLVCVSTYCVTIFLHYLNYKACNRVKKLQAFKKAA